MFKKNKLGEPNRVFYFNVKWGESLSFVESTTNLLSIAEPSDPEAKGGILGIQEAKGGRYYSEELGIDKSEALGSEEIYKIVHSKDHYEKCQQELGVVMEDRTLKYETREDGSKGAVSDANVDASRGSTTDTDSEETESGSEAIEPTEASDTNELNT